MKRIESTFHYLKSFFTDPKVASVTPTSRFGVRRVCRPIDFNKELTIVEYGPGTGVFTKYIQARMSAQSKLILIEKNKNFIPILKEKVAAPQVEIYHDSAENILSILRESGVASADFIISGIPFSMINDVTKNKILSNTWQALKPSGEFLVYQHLNHIYENLENHFQNVIISKEFRNIPPITIFRALKS